MNQEDLSIKPLYVQTVFDNYLLEDKFLANRKYQRKLVWTIQEKQAFIDSLMNKYPVPLFLVALKQGKYEIIDGMQRLNAIFSFIEGEFGVVEDGVEKYFDLATMPTTNELLDNQKITQKKPILNRAICRQIATYELPFTIATFENETKIEDIFRRINSNGRHLSNHEIRQAGALGLFPDLVRTLSAEIRRDSSPSDILNLSKMKEVSLSNKSLPYGINLFDVFWVKQEIIPIYNMRISRDEELVAYILTYMILGRSVNPSTKNLDLFYKLNPNEGDKDHLSSRIENEVIKIGEENIKKRFRKIFSEIEKTISMSSSTLSVILFGGNPKGLVRSFQVLFLAFYELIVTKNMRIKNHSQLLDSLKGFGSRHLNNIHTLEWNGGIRDEKIKMVASVIEPHFEKNNKIEDPALDNWIVQLENLLNQSKIEQQQFDFKIGLHRVDVNPNFVQSTFDKVIKTLTGIANIAPKTRGYVIIGIADKVEDNRRFEAIYSIRSKKYLEFYINGIDKEAEKNFGNLDKYFSRLRDLIKNQPIEDFTKDYITRNMRLVNYFDKSVLVFQIEADEKPLLYDGKYFVRRGSSIEEIKPESYADLFNRFFKK